MGIELSSSRVSPSEASLPTALGDVAAALLALEDEAARHRLAERCLAVFPAHDFLTTLKSESERHLSINPHDALRLANVLIHSAELADRADHAALGLMAKGDALRHLGRYAESIDFFDEAGTEFLATGDEVGWARTRIGWLVSSHLLGHGAEALEAIAAAYDILTSNGESRRAAALDLNAAAVCYWLGRYDEALQRYDRAQWNFEQLGASAEDHVGFAKSNKAEILTLLGDFAGALELHFQVRDIFFRHGQTANIHRLDHYIADVYLAQGNYSRALRTYADALAGLERDGLDADAAWTALTMVECYLNLNRTQEALELARETIARFERLGSPTEAAKSRLVAAVALTRIGARDEALDLLAAAAATFAETAHAAELALATLLRAALSLAEADWDAALDHATRARTLFAERGLVVRQAQADLVCARAFLGSGQIVAAVELARTVLASIEEREILWLGHEAHHILAQANLASGDTTAALVSCRQGIAAIEQVQGRLAVELRTNFLEDKLGIYHDAIACCLRLGRPLQAFAYLERAKSRALVDFLSTNPEVRLRASEPTSRELVEELTRLRDEHNWFYDRLYGYGLARRLDEGDGAATAEADTLRTAIRERERQISRLRERLALHENAWVEEAELGGQVDPVPPDLDENTVLLEYYLHEEQAAVFIASHAGLEVIPLDLSTSTLRRYLSHWQLNLDAAAPLVAAGAPLSSLGRNALGILQTLYRALIAPVALHLQGRDRLVVVPHGPLHTLPFHALHDGHRHLVENHEVAASPSSMLLQLCATRPRRSGRSALVVAYDDAGRLPFVRDEAAAVSSFLPGESFLNAAATRASLVGAAPRHRAIHLIAHGEARLDSPTFAHLKLADGQLAPADIFSLDLNGTIVTISACETGRSAISAGDELIGLSRGFLHAGANTLIQSLWRVEDDSTARTMTHFYRQLATGHRAGAALREAQLALLADRGDHPYYWAPFQLVGDGGPL